MRIRRCLTRFCFVTLVSTLPHASAAAQPVAPCRTDTLTLMMALRLVRATSPALRAEREAVVAARGRERQAGARLNPVFAYGREQTSRGGQRNLQDIASIEQPLDLAGQRVARVAAERLARESAELRLAAAESESDGEVVRAFAQVVAADRRADLANRAATAFAAARRVSEVRLVAGDVSGYAARRMRLEATRYAALLAEAILTRESARVSLASLLPTDASWTPAMPLAARSLDIVLAPAVDDVPALRERALRQRAVVRLGNVEVATAAAQSRLIRRTRIPLPSITAGFKREGASPAASAAPRSSLLGFVAGLSLPLPLFDRQVGALESAAAEERRRVALSELTRRQVAREVDNAVAAVAAVEAQYLLLQPLVEVDAPAALRAAQVSYDEGEISLLEWLDAVRAYYETESAYTTLVTERAMRRVELARATGTPLIGNGGTP